MRPVFTVGHSNHSTEYFINLLLKYKITHLIDVRSNPYSRFVPQYNKEAVKAKLLSAHINYIYMGKSLGARRNEEELFMSNGILDFEKVKNCDTFQSGVKQVIKGAQQDLSIALMCTEKEPIDCHRAILVGDALGKQGIAVQHILSDGSLQSHERLEAELLDMYFPNRQQCTIFDICDFESQELKYLIEAYYRRNIEIGYNRRKLD